MISVVVNGFNEGNKLKKCLESIYDWADEIIVVDMSSTDDTKAVAKQFKAKVFEHDFVDYVEPVREFAVSKATNKWVLILDPDEELTPTLKSELYKISKEDLAEGVNIPRLNLMFGKKIKHTNFWPDRQIRFFKKDKITFSKKIHSYPKIQGRVLDLPAEEKLAIQHYSYESLTEYWKKMQRYSTVEARNLYEEGKRFSIIDFFYMPVYDFSRRYIRHLGFLDGLAGLELSLLQAYYYMLVQLKLLKMEDK